MAKRLIPSDPYLPRGGMNKDSESLSMTADQCVFLQNGRIFPDRVNRRDGLASLPDAPDPAKPFLEFATYKTPDGVDQLFGFTEDRVFAFDEGAEAWDNVLDIAEFPATDLTDIQSAGTALTHWHLTLYTDASVGATIVAWLC